MLYDYLKVGVFRLFRKDLAFCPSFFCFSFLLLLLFFFIFVFLVSLIYWNASAGMDVLICSKFLIAASKSHPFCTKHKPAYWAFIPVLEEICEMSDCWVAGSAAGGAGCGAFGEADDESDGLKTPPRAEAPWARGGTADGVNGIEGCRMITPFIPSGRVWSNAPVPRKEWTIMVSDRILAGYPAFNARDPSGASTKINVLENDLYVPEGNSLNCPCIMRHNLT